MTDIRLYAGIGGELRWNGTPVRPGADACISPVYGRAKRRENRVPSDLSCAILQDSGAFSDNWNARLTFAESLTRQERHAEKFNYAHLIAYRVSYDLLIDEVWDGNNRYKRRWSVAAAEAAVDTTVAAARFLHQNRNGLPLCLSAQGVDAPQYLRCVQRMMPFMRDEDCFGLGGWCIIGKLPRQMMPVFAKTVQSVIPFLAREGVRRVHLFGVIYPRALAVLLRACDEYGIAVSTDSVGPTTHPAFGQWGYGEWRDNAYVRPAPERMGDERARHTALTREWLASFRTSRHYSEFGIPLLSRWTQIPLI